MKRSLVLALVVGAGLGIGITSLVFWVSRSGAPEPVPTTKNRGAEPTPPPLAKIEPAPTPPPLAKIEPAPPPPTKPAFDFKASFAVLAQKGLAAYSSKEMAVLADAVKASGKDGLGLVTEQLQNSTSPQERFLAAALLEKIADPAALSSLDAALKNDPDPLVRRMASHAAALIGTDAVAHILRSAMTKDEDWGVRVNSAYGLAKLKQQDGLDTLEQFYASTETPAEYRLAILGGLADVAAPTTGPLFRQILADTTDAGYVLTAIAALEKMKNAQALPDLQRIAASAKSETIRQAAQRAIDNIAK